MYEWKRTMRRETNVRLRDLEGTVRIACYLLVGVTAYSLLIDLLLSPMKMAGS